MAQDAPGKHYRKGLSLVAAVKMFGDGKRAEAWFVKRRWPKGIRCPRCDSDSIKPRNTQRRTPVYHCNGCKFDFTVKAGTIMQESKLSLEQWGLAFYLYSTNLKGVSSMKLHRDLGITQKSAWHLAHRIRETWDDEAGSSDGSSVRTFTGPVEVDETYVGGKERHKHASEKLRAGRGTVGKVAVVGIKDRETNRIEAKVVASTDGPTLKSFVRKHTEPGAVVYTDDNRSYLGLERPYHFHRGFRHEAIRHSVREFVRGMAHTNGIESYWSMLKRGYNGVYHHFSAKHLPRYIHEFSGRHNARPLDTEDQMADLVSQSEGKCLPYARLIGPVDSRKPEML